MPDSKKVTAPDISLALQPTAGDHAHMLGRMAAGLIPGAGGAIVEVMNAFGAPLARRRDEWLVSVWDRLGELEQSVDSFSVEALAEDEEFLTVLAHAADSARRNHQSEKLDALRNAVLNTALKIDLSIDVKLSFLALIDDFTTSHMEVLAFARCPFEWMTRRGLNPPEEVPRDWSARRHCLLDLRKDEEFYQTVIEDLRLRRLISSETTAELDNTPSKSRLLHSYLQPHGKRFWEFFCVPKQLQSDRP